MIYPSLVSKGVADLGIVGQNVLAEQAATNKKITAKDCTRLRIFKVQTSICKAVKFKTEVSQQDKRIATSYPALVKKYLIKEYNKCRGNQDQWVS